MRADDAGVQRTRHQQALEKYESLIQKNEQLSGQLQKLGEEISAQSTKAPEFIGYFAHQSYRAKNNAGDTLIGEKYFLFDKDISTVTFSTLSFSSKNILTNNLSP